MSPASLPLRTEQGKDIQGQHISEVDIHEDDFLEFRESVAQRDRTWRHSMVAGKSTFRNRFGQLMQGIPSEQRMIHSLI